MLSNHVLGVLVEIGYSPSSQSYGVWSDVAGHSHDLIAFSCGLHQTVNAFGVESGVCVYSNGVVHFLDGLGLEEARELGEKFGRDHLQIGICLALVELVQKCPDQDDAISFAAILVLDDANDWKPSEFTFDDFNVHWTIVPGSVRFLHECASRTLDNVFFQMGGSRLGHALAANATIANYDDSLLVIIQRLLLSQRNQRVHHLRVRFVVAA